MLCNHLSPMTGYDGVAIGYNPYGHTRGMPRKDNRKFSLCNYLLDYRTINMPTFLSKNTVKINERGCVKLLLENYKERKKYDIVLSESIPVKDLRILIISFIVDTYDVVY